MSAAPLLPPIVAIGMRNVTVRSAAPAMARLRRAAARQRSDVATIVFLSGAGRPPNVVTIGQSPVSLEARFAFGEREAHAFIRDGTRPSASCLRLRSRLVVNEQIREATSAAASVGTWIRTQHHRPPSHRRRATRVRSTAGAGNRSVLPPRTSTSSPEKTTAGRSTPAHVRRPATWRLSIYHLESRLFWVS